MALKMKVCGSKCYKNTFQFIFEASITMIAKQKKCKEKINTTDEYAS